VFGGLDTITAATRATVEVRVHWCGTVVAGHDRGGGDLGEVGPTVSKIDLGGSVIESERGVEDVCSLMPAVGADRRVVSKQAREDDRVKERSQGSHETLTGGEKQLPVPVVREPHVKAYV
jgi:hypothetical protein